MDFLPAYSDDSPLCVCYWLHGLHGEAFEEVVFFFLPFLPTLWASITVSCFCQIGHRGEQIDWVDIVELPQLVLATLEDSPSLQRWKRH